MPEQAVFDISSGLHAIDVSSLLIGRQGRDNLFVRRDWTESSVATSPFRPQSRRFFGNRIHSDMLL
jgi:hypothetical protein